MYVEGSLAERPRRFGSVPPAGSIRGQSCILRELSMRKTTCYKQEGTGKENES